jgi:hypothetical protein
VVNLTAEVTERGTEYTERSIIWFDFAKIYF